MIFIGSSKIVLFFLWISMTFLCHSMIFTMFHWFQWFSFVFQLFSLIFKLYSFVVQCLLFWNDFQWIPRFPMVFICFASFSKSIQTFVGFHCDFQCFLFSSVSNDSHMFFFVFPIHDVHLVSEEVCRPMFPSPRVLPHPFRFRSAFKWAHDARIRLAVMMPASIKRGEGPVGKDK